MITDPRLICADTALTLQEEGHALASAAPIRGLYSPTSTLREARWRLGPRGTLHAQAVLLFLHERRGLGATGRILRVARRFLDGQIAAQARAKHKEHSA